MTRTSTTTRRVGMILAGCQLLLASAVSAESPITTPQQVDRDYEIASKDFGDGFVQLHSRKDGADGSAHAVHSFDCANKSYASVYSGETPPEAFPLDSLGFNLNQIEENSEVAALAQHACRKHGYPLLEW
ncbi:hypothetical protein AB9K34_19850 [Sedimentitalea sp. XS_ASV28]|uniref:hypothetical protein n=1 Tax=Sedimentitalea sp. XS_ASV28 TaxID=3241296 RepID=UPI003516D036